MDEKNTEKTLTKNTQTSIVRKNSRKTQKNMDKNKNFAG